MSFFTGLMETLCGYALAWGANVAVFTVFLCLTGRFWQRNAAPALRRAGYLVAIYIAFLPQFYKVALPLLSMLHDGFPEAVPAEVGVALCLPVAGQTPLPALRATNWAALAGAVWLLGALICAVARILPRRRFGKWLRANGRPLGRRAAGILQRAEEQQRAVEELSPEERLVARRGLSPHPHPVHDAFVVEGIPGPMCVKGLLAGGPCLLLDREDYDAETLDAIFRHELSHLAPGGDNASGATRTCLPSSVGGTPPPGCCAAACARKTSFAATNWPTAAARRNSAPLTPAPSPRWPRASAPTCPARRRWPAGTTACCAAACGR